MQLEQRENMPDDEHDPTVAETVVKEVGKIASSPADTVLKYIVVCVLALFGVMFYLTWRDNQDQPDKLYTLLERSVNEQSNSLKIQESVLKELQAFSIRVPLEHQSTDQKISAVAADVVRMSAVQEKICVYQEEIRAAILANTQAIAKLIESWERRDQVEP